MKFCAAIKNNEMMKQNYLLTHTKNPDIVNEEEPQ